LLRGLTAGIFREISGQIGWRNRLNGHLNEAYKRTTKIWFRFAAPIDNHTNRSRGQQRNGEFL
jgi:hypothetical protein